MKKYILLTLILCGGCISTSFESQDGIKFKRTALGNKTTLGNLTMELGTNGVRKLVLKSYGNDQTALAVEIAEAVARGASGSKP